MKGGKTVALTLVILRSLFRNRPGRKQWRHGLSAACQGAGRGGELSSAPLGPWARAARAHFFSLDLQGPPPTSSWGSARAELAHSYPATDRNAHAGASPAIPRAAQNDGGGTITHPAP